MADHPFLATAAPLTAMLRRLALDVAEAQAALDRRVEEQAESNPALPPLSFYFPEVQVDLAIALSFGRIQGRTALSATPANPASAGFFRAASFNSRLRARIAPLAWLVPASENEESDG
jgi:hypothetical protein